MRFIIAALVFMAMISTASAQLDQFMTMQLIKNMQQQNKSPGTGGASGGHGLSGNLAAMMMGDMVPEMSDIIMNNYLMSQMKGHNSGTTSASGGGLMGMGGMNMNPFMAAGMDSSDLALWSLMNRNNNQQNAKHNRAQMMGGGFQNPLASAMMLDTMTGNDFLGSMEGLGAMALMGGGMGGGMPPMMGMSPIMGMSPMMGGGAYPNYNYGTAAPPQYAYPQPKKYYAPHAASPTRGVPHQYMPGMGMGIGRGPMGGMGMGGMGNNPMQKMMMMDAMSGGDLLTNDFAKDYGGMMMMSNMMRPQRSPMMGYNPYQYNPSQYSGYYYPAQPASVASSSAQPIASSNSGGFGSRIKDKFTGKRGGIYDNLWEMNLIQSLLNPNPATGAAAGTGAGAAGINPAQLAAVEMALGDASQNPAQQKEGAIENQVAGAGTSSDAVVVDPKGQQ